MSFHSVVPSTLCPLMSHPDLCPFKTISPQICVLWRHTQIYLLQNICSLRSVVFWHNTQIKVICEKKYPHKSVSSTFCTERNKTFTAINSRIHIWDTHWLVLVWYLVSFTHLCSACFFCFLFFSCNLWSYCSMHDSVHKTKNRPLYLFYTDCINPNSVAIRPSLYEIFVISFFYGLLSHGHLFHISVFFYLCDPWSVILLIPAWNHF